MRSTRIRAVFSGLAILVGLGALGAPGVVTIASASAAPADATPTQIVLSATPSVVTYPQPEITVSGVLETTGASPQPLAKTLVWVSFPQGEGTGGANLFTNSAGQFTWKITEPVPAPVTAQFFGSSQYSASSSTASVTAAQVFPAKIMLDPITPAPIFSTITITGTLLMQPPDSSWVPSPYALVATGDSADQRHFTDQSGRFAVAAVVYPGQPVTISTSAGFGGTFWWSGAATTGPLTLPLSADPTSVCGAIGTDVSPAPAADMGFTIHTCYEDATGAGHNYTGPVQLSFQPAAGGNWILMSAAKTAADGFAHVTVSGYLASGGLAAGNWRWVVPAAPGFAASGSGSFAVVITVPTKISGVRFARSGSRERLSGRLSYQTAGVARAAVVIQRFSRGRWRQVAVARTNSSGGFTYRFSRRLTGRYRVSFRGSALPGAEAHYGSFEPALSGAARFR